MNEDKLIAVVGHSLVPRSIKPVDGAKISIYRAPGAKACNFESNEALSSVLSFPHDLTIIFIGGNDIYNNCTPSYITHNIQTLIEQVHDYCHSHICFILLESRHPPVGNRFNIDAEQYNKVANNINNRLKRKYKNKTYVQFLSVGAKPFQHGVTDGVHFDFEAKAHLQLKIRNTIKRFVEGSLYVK